MKYLIFCFTSCTVTIACQSLNHPCGSDKNEFLYSYHQFIQELEEEKGSLAPSDWKEKDESFDRYTNQCYPKYKEEFTRSDRQEYMQNTFTYYGMKYGSGLGEFMETEGEEISRMIEESIDDWVDQDGKEIKESLEEWFDTEGKEISHSINQWMDTEGREIARDIERTLKKVEQEITKEKVEATLDKISEFLDELKENLESN